MENTVLWSATQDYIDYSHGEGSDSHEYQLLHSVTEGYHRSAWHGIIVLTKVG